MRVSSWENPVRNWEAETQLHSTSSVSLKKKKKKDNNILQRTTEVCSSVCICGWKRNLQEQNLSSCSAGNKEY